MSHAFSFGFSNDDDSNEDIDMASETDIKAHEDTPYNLIDPQQYSFDDLVSDFPAFLNISCPEQ